MAAKYVLALLAAVFLFIGAFDMIRASRRAPRPQVRTWLLVGAIFGAVSAWLFSQR
jgi:hypothetical protein